ncbi:DUF3151 domain-containing protein [Helicobacter pylori]
MVDNLLGIPETKLPEDPASARIEAGEDAAKVAADLPSSSLPWAVLAEAALDGGRSIEGYAYARTGYHRGLDALRRSGWKGQGPVPWAHVPNRGFLRALAALSQAAGEIGESDEEARCRTFLTDFSLEAARALLG